MMINNKAFDKEAKIRGEMVNFERQRILKIIDDLIKSKKKRKENLMTSQNIIYVEDLEELRKRILNDASAKPYASEQHIGSDLCPQTVQRSTEGLPDGCAEKPKYVIESTEGEMTSEELDKRAKKITGVEK